MVRSVSYLTAMCLFAGAAIGQQAGDSNRDYAINGSGAGQTGVVATDLISCNQCGSFVNEYSTLDSGSPILWVTSTQTQVGWLSTPTNSVDIGPGNLSYLFDGTDPSNPLAALYSTDALGNYNFSLPVPQAIWGTSRAFAMAHFAPSSPDGFWVSQTHDVSFAANNLSNEQYSNVPFSATTVSLSDDGSVLVPLGMSFNYFSASYTEVWINANGNLTFGAGSSSFVESAAGLVAGSPRIAALWDDLNPAVGGLIAYETRSTPFSGTTFTVWYQGVPQINDTRPNLFSISLRRSGIVVIGGNPTETIAFDYETLAGPDALVGLSPGAAGGSANMSPIDLSLGGFTIPGFNRSVFELFNLSKPLDLAGHRVLFNLDPNGQPLMVN